MAAMDEKLSESCRDAGQAIRDGIQWLGANAATLKLETGGLVKELKRAAVAAGKLEAAATRKMCVGVFGPSQAGKSYMISALARRGTERLMADFAGLPVDFIAEINPAGGKELTGVVTRFTIEHGAPSPAGHPVEIRLLTEIDVVKILVNAYVNDIVHDQEDESQHDATKILEALDQLAPRMAAGPVGPLGEDQCTDLEEYCNERLIGNPRIKVLRRIGFWDRLAELAPRLAVADRAKLFTIIWDGLEVFTGIYRRLYDALASIDFAPTAYCALDGLCTLEGGVAKRRAASIINVETLAGLGDPDATGADSVSISTGKRQAMMRRAELTALIAELKIVMKDRPYAFFDHTDLLDFPGARSRKANEVRHIAQPGVREELFLRGKVAYLFERYCAEQELTSMLLCMGPENMEVVSLPGLVFEWIRATQGEKPADRVGRPNALFLIMTKFDMAFAQGAGSETGPARWSTRLQTSLLKPFSAHPAWPLEWTPGRAFDNCLWIRNPNFRQDAIFDYASPDSLVETGVRSDKVKFVGDLRKWFLENEDVHKHFSDPVEAWEAALNLNDGGISLVVRRLEPLCNPALKRDQVTGRLQRLVDSVQQRLQPLFFTGDINAEQIKKEAMVQRIAERLAACIANQAFGEFLRALQIPESDVYDIYLSSERRTNRSGDTSGERQAVRKSTIGAAVESKAIVDRLFRKPAGANGNGAGGGTEIRDSAEQFAKAVEQFWGQRMNGFAREPMWLGYFDMTATDIVDLELELTTAMRRTGAIEAMAQTIRQASQFKDISKEALIWRQAIPAGLMINQFVDWLGYGGPGRPAGSEVEFDGDKRQLFAQRPPVGTFPVLPEEPQPFDTDYAIDWLFAFRDLVRQNVAFRAGVEINVVENARLGEVLGRLTASRAA